MSFIKIVILISLLGVTGCAGLFHPKNLNRLHAYDGNKLPASELGTFYGKYDPGADTLFIDTVDGEEFFTMGVMNNYTSIAYVKPGVRKIGFLYMWAGRFARSEIFEIDVKKGDVYAIHGTTDDGESVRFWIESKPKNYKPTNLDLMPSLPVN